MGEENKPTQDMTASSLSSDASSDELDLSNIVNEIEEWRPACNPNKVPRIVVFGQCGTGKSSFLNNLHWVLEFKNRESPGQFKQIVPSSRENGVTGGGNTNRLRKVRIGPMEFVDTRGYPSSDTDFSREIRRICDGSRDFVTDIIWNGRQKFRFQNIFKAACRPVDFAILIVSAKHPEYSATKKVIHAIKEGAGCIPVVVVTSKNKIPKGEEVHMHSQFTGMGADWAFFVENYLVDSDGNGPKNENLNIEQHLDFCKVLQVIQSEYDRYQEALSESQNGYSWNCIIIISVVVLLIVIVIAIYLK